MPEISFQWLDRIEYSNGLELQNQLVNQRVSREIRDTVLFLEHEPVYTIGRTRDRSSLKLPDGQLPHPLVEINRGGQATYHGPGQLVGYLILDLHQFGQDLHTYLRAVEQMLITFLQSIGLSPGRKNGLTGVWIDDRKIASIGIGVKKWVSMHGFGLNVSSDLSGYDAIIPCGISNVEMTSIAKETGSETWNPQNVGEALVPFIEAELRKLRQKS